MNDEICLQYGADIGKDQIITDFYILFQVLISFSDFLRKQLKYTHNYYFIN